MAIDGKPNDVAPPKPKRLVSLDAYRGFVMLAMVSEGLGLSHVAESLGSKGIWSSIHYQLTHVSWIGCSAWDLIQPSFMFIVGVSMPYSFARRKMDGESSIKRTLHVIWRAAFLVCLGIFLRSNNGDYTNFTFEDVTTQIGLGYGFAYLTLGMTWRGQLATATLLLLGYWMLFAFWPISTPSLADASGVPSDWDRLSGFATHWNKHLNAAGAFDRWFMNLFPRPATFIANGGGYQTLSFIPAIATTTFGVIAGGLLRSEHPLGDKVKWLLLGGLGMLALGILLDGNMWPFMDWHWSICPVVKRIWTPSWAVFSTGWTLLMLAVFVWVIDLKGYQRWAFPFLVVGMNSLAIYCMSWLLRPWLVHSAEIHFGPNVFAGTYGPVIKEVYITITLWLICYWLYRRKVFIRI